MCEKKSYSKTVYGGDNPNKVGESDRNSFNKNETHEVSDLIAEIKKDLKIKNSEDISKIKTIILEKLDDNLTRDEAKSEILRIFLSTDEEF